MLSTGSNPFPKTHDRQAARSCRGMTNIVFAKGNTELSILCRTRKLLSASYGLLIVGRCIAAASNHGLKLAARLG